MDVICSRCGKLMKTLTEETHIARLELVCKNCAHAKGEMKQRRQAACILCQGRRFYWGKKCHRCKGKGLEYVLYKRSPAN